MGGIAAVAICAAFTSCSKSNELFDQNAAEQAKQQTSEQKIISDYQTAFENAFGQPASNQDWGLSKYGSVNSAGTRAIIAEINDPFTYYENTDQFYISEAKDVPSKAKTYDLHCQDFTRADWGGNIDYNAAQASDAWITLEGENTIKFTGGEHTFYVIGDATLNVPDYINQAKIYVLSGKTFTLNMTNYINALEIYVADGATLNYNYEKLYKQTGDAKIFNRGTLNVPDNFEINQDAIVYNEGTMIGKDITSKPGDGHPSYFYNYGNLDLSGDLELNSCANFFNEGTVTVTGKTTATQANIWWINKGHYTTGTLDFSAHNKTFYNYCNLIVTGHAKMYTGEFNLMDNSYTEVGSANLGQSNFRVNMGSNAGFNAKGNVKFEKNADGTEQGFFATGSKAYVRIDGKAQVEKHKYVFVLDGNITYAIKDGVENLEALDPYYTPYSEFRSGTTEVKAEDFAKFTATPKTDGCGATWNVPSQITYKGRIMGEDLTAMSDNDFDFNDVVFDWAISADKKTAYIKLWAAGGTLPLKIGTAVGEGQEVHALFGVSTSTMVNTGVGANGITKEPVEFEITKTNGTFNSAEDIIVSVDKTSKGSNGYMQMTAKIGQAPCLLFVPLNTKWVDEYENIEKAYTWFKDYVGGAADKWSEAPVEKYVDLDLSNNK